MAVEPTRLRFYSCGKQVQNYELLDQSIKKFLGWKLVQVAPPTDLANPEDKGKWEYQETGEVSEVPNRAEYRKACKDGDLVAADAETADACGVPFTKTPKTAEKAEKAA